MGKGASSAAQLNSETWGGKGCKHLEESLVGVPVCIGMCE